MQLSTQRFLLRDFAADDAQAFAAYRGDSRYARLYAPEESTPQHSAHLLTLFRDWAKQQPRQNYQLAVVQLSEPFALIGCAGLRRAGLPEDQAELGLELAPDFWGRHAYAVEIGQALLDLGFRELGLQTITGSTISANDRISRLAEWFGAEMVATRVGAEWMMDQNWSHADWHITRERWLERTRSL